MKTTLSLLWLGTAAASVHHVPLFQAPQLSRNPFFFETLSTTGLLALPLPNPRARAVALGGLCQCSHKLKDIEGGDSITLRDGQTVRSSLATATASPSLGTA